MNIADEKNIKHDNLVPTQDEIVLYLSLKRWDGSRDSH